MSKLVVSVSVCTALLAASAAVSGAYAANDKSSAISTTSFAYAALIEGRNSMAIQQYSVAIKSNSLPVEQLGRAYLNRALAYQNVDRMENAVEDYTSAMKLDSLSANIRAVAFYNRGLAHQKLKSPAMAIEDYTAALLLNPKFARAYYSRANVLREHGQYLFALADYKKARYFKHPSLHLTYFGEALTYDALRQRTRAKSLLLKTVSVKPGFKPARIKLASMGQTVALPENVTSIKKPKIQIFSMQKQHIPRTLITGSLSTGQFDQTIRGSDPLPKAVPVPKNLTAAPAMPKLPAVAVAPTPKPATKSASRTKTPRRAKTVVVPTNKQPAPVVTASKSSTLSGWTVQLTSQRKSTAAWDVWKNLTIRHARILGGKKAAVVKADLGSRGIYYRLRVHKLDSKKKAANLCNQLKRKGTSCFISKA